MKETLNYILNNYSNAKNQGFRDNLVANYIRKTAVKNICEKASIDKSKYIVEGSPGKGAWADVPWIAVFDKDITDTATKGYDIVYLFCADMSGVYISLNQGWTYFREKYGTKDGREKIRTVSSAWKKILSSTLNDFSFDKIQLKGISKNSNLSIGYELGHICGKFYKAGEIPDDSVLIEDLRNLIGVYREVKGKLEDNSIEKTNNHILLNYDLGLFNDETEIEDVENIIMDLEVNSNLIKEDPPVYFTNRDNENITFNPRKINFLKKSENQRKLGLAGELMVLKYEKENLINNGKQHLADNVKHVSKVDGDGAGYDILSFEIDGTLKYIEVKTTTGNSSTPFKITHTELKFSEINKDNYYLYRVFEFNKENGTGNLYILNGDISLKLDMKATEYIVKGIR